jgi:hypothetical protein
MRVIFTIFLGIFVAAQFVVAESPPTIELVPNDALEILNPVAIRSGSSITVSGQVKRSAPWADTAWDHIEISLYDERGSLILEVATDYSPRPIPHPYRSAYEPSSRFAVKINGVTRPVRTVRIASFPGSVSHLTGDRAR